MRPRIGQPSATPILDLLEPLPELGKEKANGRFATPFLAFVGFIVVTGNYSFLVVPFGLLAINFLAIAIHELGHLLSGWCVGLRFVGVRVDPFELRVDSGRWRFIVRPRLFWGYAVMRIDKVCRVRRRLAVCTAGGPLASIGFGLVAVIAGEIGLALWDSGWPTFLEFLGAWSLAIGCFSLVPFYVRGFANDGMLLRALSGSKPEATQLIASHALFIAKTSEILPPDYYRRWFRMAAAQTKTKTADYYSGWMAYEDEPDSTKAAVHLEKCLSYAAWMNQEQRDKLVVEAACFCACRRSDLVRAQAWLKRLTCSDRLHAIQRLRIDAAICYAKGQFEPAMRAIEQGLKLVRNCPKGKERERIIAKWSSWRDDIARRIPATVL